MENTAVVGMQWGDEGKGKIVDFLAKFFDFVVRYQGGHNAGHTVVFDGVTYKLHHLPSGILRGKLSVMGNGMVIDPEILLKEIGNLDKIGIDTSKLYISEGAHVITPYHKEIDRKKGKKSEQQEEA